MYSPKYVEVQDVLLGKWIFGASFFRTDLAVPLTARFIQAHGLPTHNALMALLAFEILSYVSVAVAYV
jgi:hypothetical protein